MKTNHRQTIALVAVGLLLATGGQAQEQAAQPTRKQIAVYDSRSPLYERTPYFRTFFNVDWQLNGTIDNDIASDFGGWGASFTGGYYLTPHWGLGLFAAYHTNEEYVPRSTFPWHDGLLNTDQIHSLYQLPFGVTARYRFWSGTLMPYIGVKAGAEYARATTYINGDGWYNTSWGFFVSPEVGVEVHPFKRAKFGFHVGQVRLPRGGLLQLRHQRQHPAVVQGRRAEQLRRTRGDSVLDTSYKLRATSAMRAVLPTTNY